MIEWISVEEAYPKHKQNIKIRVEDTEGKEHELECTFNDHADYRGWEIKPVENVTIYAKPTHWMPLPKPPQEKESYNFHEKGFKMVAI